MVQKSSNSCRLNILLISPQTPDTFWSFKHAIRFVSRKASMAPLGLLTVAAMLPPEWELKLVDLNVEKLKDEVLRWADYVLLGAMIVQKDSVRERSEEHTSELQSLRHL